MGLQMWSVGNLNFFDFFQIPQKQQLKILAFWDMA
jgi:hypothetical protein